MIAFWYIQRRVGVDRRFRGTYCLHYGPDKAVRTSETSVYFNETTRGNIPDGFHLLTADVFGNLISTASK
jgi:hypothetical protein